MALTKRRILASIYLAINLLLTSCNNDIDQQTDKNQVHRVEITGRNRGIHLERPLIYSVNIPKNWREKEPLPDESLTDTKKPIYEISIDEGGEQAFITIHNFPAEEAGSRIPPEAQITRWRQQLGGQEAQYTKVDQQAFGGFSGLRFEGQGRINGTNQIVMAWSMQISPEHFYALSQEHEGLTSLEREQMRADYTIKAMGTPGIMNKNREAIHQMARSFRLIKPVPNKR